MLSRIPSILILAIAAVVACAPTTTEAAVVYGLHSLQHGSPPDYSTSPTNFFSVDTTPDSIQDYGPVTVGGSGGNFDGLSVSSSGRAVAFRINSTATTSTLVEIAPGSLYDGVDGVTATALGTAQSYYATGAAYDNSGNLWVVDNPAGNLLRVDDTSGAVLSTTPLANAGGNTNNYAAIGNSLIDLDFDSGGTGYVVGNNNTVWTLNTSTGVLTDLGVTSNIVSGAAVNPANDDEIYVLTNSGIDMYGVIDVSAAPSLTVLGSAEGTTGISGGRGDMAAGAFIVPQGVVALHYGNSDPTSEGWNAFEIDSVGTPGVDANAGPISEGGSPPSVFAWQLNDSLAPEAFNFPTYEQDISTSDFQQMYANGWELDFTSSYADSDASGNTLQIGFSVQNGVNPWNNFDEMYRVTLDVDSADGTLTVGAGSSGTVDTGLDASLYHTIRMIAGARSDTYDVLIDGVRIFDGASALVYTHIPALRNSIFFGTNTSGGAGHAANFASVRLTIVPEPASLLVWAGGAMLLLALRRRRRR